MSGLFRKENRQKEDAPLQGFMSAVSGKVLKVQLRWATYLNKKTSLWGPKQLKIFLVIFCLLSVIVSVAIIGKAVRYPPKILSINPVMPMQRNGAYTADKALFPEIFISKAEYEQLRQFRQYMDSLGLTGNGRQIKDSLLSCRPGLMDSLAQVEQLYNNQK